MHAVWVRDLVVEEAGQDEAYARAAGASHVREHAVEACDCHGDDVAEDDDGGCYGSEARFANGLNAGGVGGL